MITIRYMPKCVKVYLGMDRNWQRCFRFSDVIHAAADKENVLMINDDQVSFDFVEVRGARTIRNGFTCLLVVWKAASTSAEGNKYHLTKVGIILKPQLNSEEVLTAEDFLKKHALVKFTEEEKKQWQEEKKLKLIKL